MNFYRTLMTRISADFIYNIFFKFVKFLRRSPLGRNNLLTTKSQRHKVININDLKRVPVFKQIKFTSYN